MSGLKIKNYDYGPIGKRIREARLAKGMTQQMLADYILRGRASSNPNHPYNKTTKNMNTKQRMITEEILRILAEGFDAKTI